LITGASSGIGSVFARHLAEQGYQLILVARRGERLKDLADQLQSVQHITHESLVADLATQDGIALVSERIKSCNTLTTLINSAGFGTYGDFAEVPWHRQADMVTLHITATIALCHAALPGMLSRGKGDIINVSSVSAFLAGSGSANYCATKAYLNTFTRALHEEVRDSGIRVQALCPGFTITEFHDTPELAEFNRSDVPKRLWLSADQVVRESLKGLNDGKIVGIPGFLYRRLVTLFGYRWFQPFLRLMMKKRPRASVAASRADSQE
jgi:short-subunit dehydrogenase